MENVDVVTPRPRLPAARRWKRWLSLRGYGIVTSTLFGARTPPLKMRYRFESLSRVARETLLRRFPALVFGDYSVERLRIESVCAVQAPARVILYLHGGAFFMGSLDSYRERAMRVSYRCQAEVFVPAYRLAPEHAFPAALEDAFAAWKFVRALRPDQPIFVAGDSAGGGLSLSLLLKIRDAGQAMPDGLFALSPWTDLTVSGASVERNRGRDLWFTRGHLETWTPYYVGHADARSPQVSPVFGDYAGLPPLMLLVGEDELLLDDARRVAERARSSGVEVRLLIGEGMQHDWPLTLPWLEESRHAWKEILRFLVETAAFRMDGPHPGS